MARVEVVIATYNRPIQLRRCLEGLAAQSLDDFAVTVVDDASDLRIDETLSGDLRSRLDLKVVRSEENHGPGRSRNLGVERSSAELIAFIDDDVVPDPDMLKRHEEAYDSGPDNSIQFGPLKAPDDWEPTPWNLWEARTIAHEYRRMERGVYQATWRQFFTGNAFLARKHFQAVGGFNEAFTRAEDIELAYRLAAEGCTFRFVPDAIGWHYAERSRQSWQRIARDYARFDVAIDGLHPELNWLGVRNRERADRHRLSKLGYAALSRVSGQRIGSEIAVRSAQLLHRCGAVGLAQPLLSFAYSVEYEAEMTECLGSKAGLSTSRSGSRPGSSPA